MGLDIYTWGAITTIEVLNISITSKNFLVIFYVCDFFEYVCTKNI
jgi:hypothetical protein